MFGNSNANVNALPVMFTTMACGFKLHVGHTPWLAPFNRSLMRMRLVSSIVATVLIFHGTMRRAQPGQVCKLARQSEL